MGATRLRRWWRPVAGLGLVLGGMVALTVVFAVYYAVGLSVEDAARGSAAGPLLDRAGALAVEALDLLLISTFIALAVLAVVLVEGRPAGTLASVAGRLRWRWLWACVGVAVLATPLTDLVWWLLYEAAASLVPALDDQGGLLDGTEWVGWEQLLPLMAVVVLFTPLQAAGEEYLVRGWLLQAVGAWTRSPWPAIALSAVLFSALHLPVGVAAWVAGLVAGVALGWLAVRTGGLEAPIAVHVVNNIVASFFAASAGISSEDATIGTADWWTVAFVAVQYVVVIPLILTLARVLQVARVTPDADPPAA